MECFKSVKGLRCCLYLSPCPNGGLPDLKPWLSPLGEMSLYWERLPGKTKVRQNEDQGRGLLAATWKAPLSAARPKSAWTPRGYLLVGSVHPWSPWQLSDSKVAYICPITWPPRDSCFPVWENTFDQSRGKNGLEFLLTTLN